MWTHAKKKIGNIFTDVTKETNVQFQHKETYFNDFAFQRLLPQKFSQLGPCMSVGDVNGDSLEDFFIGGAYNQSGKLFIQNRNQQFEQRDLVTTKKYEEDMGNCFFDADGDGDLDLMIASGSTEFEEGSPYYEPRLYVNDGHGNFSLDKKAISSSVNTSAFCIAPCDYDGDGDIDVFIGGRVSLQFPFIPKSYLLQNNNGVFTDVSSSSGVDLSKLGMVTSAVWTDFDNDHLVDLVIAGEWMPVRFFKNEKGKFREVTSTTGLVNNDGMWRSLQAIDIDKDGDIDLIAGNLGMNNKYKVDSTHPPKLVSKDIDANGSQDPVLFYYLPDKNGQRKLFPDISLGQFVQQVPSIKKRFYYNKDYAQSSLLEVIKNDQPNDVIELTSSELRSCWFENKGNGKFEKHVLAVQAQFAPINAIACDDFNNDGIIDLLVAGNEYQTEPMTGMYDASYGLLLIGQSNKTFKVVNPTESAFCVKGDVKDLKIIGNGTNNKLILVGINNQAMHVFKTE
ncbi:MAG TPA: VCBS repeat-containing protein [Chitinophagaceae bacterium]|nr:VCBS repeat-containing protein [Chitinophagaceae bacterium]